ncbi:hypothetical protein DVH24_024943 [Malus domestica]|uniref:Uncharacterized protein n=1 Tax=Malus domestica TaxID=3750 RepID=A0A498JHC5_MALDO|nr:hypothetical protein DVH24_024943 [Malus domestica]
MRQIVSPPVWVPFPSLLICAITVKLLIIFNSIFHTKRVLKKDNDYLPSLFLCPPMPSCLCGHG